MMESALASAPQWEPGGGYVPMIVIDEGCEDETESEIVGGVGEKKSLNNTRWYLQDRIYDSDELATSVCTSFNPWYKVEENEEERMQDDRSDRR